MDILRASIKQMVLKVTEVSVGTSEDITTLQYSRSSSDSSYKYRAFLYATVSGSQQLHISITLNVRINQTSQ